MGGFLGLAGQPPQPTQWANERPGSETRQMADEVTWGDLLASVCAHAHTHEYTQICFHSNMKKHSLSVFYDFLSFRPVFHTS